MYRCRICNNLTKTGESRLQHTTYRVVPRKLKDVDRWGNSIWHTAGTRQEIAGQIDVCHSCKRRLDAGESPSDLRIEFAARIQPSRGDTPREKLREGPINSGELVRESETIPAVVDQTIPAKPKRVRKLAKPKGATKSVKDLKGKRKPRLSTTKPSDEPKAKRKKSGTTKS